VSSYLPAAFRQQDPGIAGTRFHHHPAKDKAVIFCGTFLSKWNHPLGGAAPCAVRTFLSFKMKKRMPHLQRIFKEQFIIGMIS
jgi:hypothetical protein